MHRIIARAGARPRANLCAVLFFAGVCTAGLAGCGGGGGGGSKGGGGGTAPPAPTNQPGSASVGGTPAQGQQLTATVQDGNGVPGSVAYQWSADGIAISGATAATFTPMQAQVGKAISVRAAYTDLAGFAEVVTSTATPLIANVNDAPTLVLAPWNVVLTDFRHGDDQISGMEVLADGKILAAGTSAKDFGGVPDFALARYLPDGTLDPTFGIDGMVVTEFSGQSEEIGARPVVMADGKIVLAGTVDGWTGQSDIGVVRYLPNGSLDNSFGTGGKVRLGSASNYEWAKAVAMDSQSRIVVGGGLVTDPNTFVPSFLVMRLTPQGALDTTFGTGGKAIIDFQPANGTNDNYVRDLILQPDGKILVCGNANGDFGLARLNPDGSLDNSFGTGGMVSTHLGSPDEEASRMALAADGGIFVTGYTAGQLAGSPFASDVAVVRYTANGSLDQRFGNGGIVKTDLSVGFDAGLDIRVTAPDTITVAGVKNASSMDGDMAVLQYAASNGQLKSGRTRDISGGSDRGRSVTIDRDGNVFAGGYAMNPDGFTSDFAIAKFDRDLNPKPWIGPYRAVYVEGQSPAQMLREGYASDDDIAPELGHAGFSLSVQRREGPSASDQFVSWSGKLIFDPSGNAMFDGVAIGTYASSGGRLALTFNANATQSAIDQILLSIAYRNTDQTVSGVLTFEWQFKDDAGLSATALSEVVVANDHADPGDPQPPN